MASASSIPTSSCTSCVLYQFTIREIFFFLVAPRSTTRTRRVRPIVAQSEKVRAVAMGVGEGGFRRHVCVCLTRAYDVYRRNTDPRIETSVRAMDPITARSTTR